MSAENYCKLVNDGLDEALEEVQSNAHVKTIFINLLSQVYDAHMHADDV